jgi:hypothetical protein
MNYWASQDAEIYIDLLAFPPSMERRTAYENTTCIFRGLLD